MLRQWVNDSEFAGAVRLDPKSKDPLIGTQDPAESIFVIPQADGGPPIEVTGLSSFVTTKAAAYCFCRASPPSSSSPTWAKTAATAASICGMEPKESRDG